MATASTATRTTPSVTVECADCGASYQLSIRNELRHRKLDVPHRCHACRLIPHVSAEQIEEARQWWLSRFTLDELRSWPHL